MLVGACWGSHGPKTNFILSASAAVRALEEASMQPYLSIKLCSAGRSLDSYVRVPEIKLR